MLHQVNVDKKMIGQIQKKLCVEIKFFLLSHILLSGIQKEEGEMSNYLFQ
jgi:hypothetical protein